MTAFPGLPRLVKGGILQMDPASSAIRRIIPLQYNPETLRRSLQVQGAGDGADRGEALRLKGPPVETIRLEAEIDAADQLEFPDQHPVVQQHGIAPSLAALETLVYPMASGLQSSAALAAAGVIEILPAEADLTLFVWSQSRIVPVRITEFEITEEAFDPQLNPLRAKVTLAMRVLTVNDLGFNHKGGGLFMGYLRAKEQLAAKLQNGSLSLLGIGGIS